MAYAQIKDLKHPTVEDYRRLQKFLSKGKRPLLSRLGDMEKRVRGFVLVGKSTDPLPYEGKIAVNCGEEERENCLLIYTSYNSAFRKGLERLIEHVAQSDFKGHILYRVGGWPNTEEGDLSLAHVPYAFKPCFFKQAQRLGYKRALWLDTSILPLVSLNQVFTKIQERGYFITGVGLMLEPYMHEEAAQAFGVTIEECKGIPSCSAAVFGADFTQEKGAILIDEWYKAARDPNAFFSPRSDQNALSLIMKRQNCPYLGPPCAVIEKGQPQSEGALFLIDRSLVHAKYKKSKDT